MSQRPWTVPANAPVRPLSSKDVANGNGNGSGGNSNGGGGGNMLSNGSTTNLLPASVNGGTNGAGLDLDELHRKYRVMELTRKQNNEESSNTLRMQRQQIEKLKKDNERLKEDLALETRQARQANNMSATAQIAKLQDQGDIYTRKIETEKRRLEDLDKSIKRLQSGILLQRREMGGIHANRDSNNSVQKQIRILENRLDKALVKFNEALAHNKSLRDHIDNLRRERIVFDGIYNKLHRELQKKQADMGTIMADTNRAHEIRAQAQQDMMALKNAADNEQALYEAQWRALGDLIERDRKNKEINAGGGGHKNKDGTSRGGGDMGSTGMMMMPSGGGGGLGKGDPSIEAEQSLRRRVTKGAWSIATDKASIHLSMEKVQAYEEAFAKIQKSTRITDIDALVHTFVHAEDHNFSLFNYVNDLSNEIEKVEESNTNVREQIAKLRGSATAAAAAATAAATAAGIEATTSAGLIDSSSSSATTPSTLNHDLERKKLLNELDSKLSRHSARATESENRFIESSRTLQGLKVGVGSIFSRLGCASAAAQEVLGNAGVTESNIMQYLGIIEAKTNELLQAYQRQKDELYELNSNELSDPQSSNQQNQSENLTIEEQQQQLMYARNQRSADSAMRHGADAFSGAGLTNVGSPILSIRAPSAGGPNANGVGGEEDEGADEAEDADGDLAEEPINLQQHRMNLQQQQAQQTQQALADDY